MPFERVTRTPLVSCRGRAALNDPARCSEPPQRRRRRSTMRRTAAALVVIAGLLMTPTEAEATSGAIVLASVSESMIKGNSNSFQPSLSADGTKVAFASSATTLDPADTDSVPDIYVKDLITGDVTLASTSDQGIKTDQISQMPSL